MLTVCLQNKCSHFWHEAHSGSKLLFETVNGLWEITKYDFDFCFICVLHGCMQNVSFLLRTNQASLMTTIWSCYSSALSSSSSLPTCPIARADYGDGYAPCASPSKHEWHHHTHTHTHTHNDTTAKQADTRSKKEFVDIRRIPFVIFCMQSQRESQGVCYFIVRCTCKGNVKCTHPLVKGYVVVPRFRFPSNQILLQETVTHSHLSEDDSNPNPP